MSHSASPGTAARRHRPPAAGAATSNPAGTTARGVTVYGCDAGEQALVRRVAARLGVSARITEREVGAENAHLAVGNRCISIGHRTPVTGSTLRALRRAGVEYVSTRSIGCDHIDLAYAERVGIRVGNVAYSPDGVADFTLMLVLMAIRHAKSIVRRSDVHDYRRGPAPGRELRDLTVGVVGTGRIGSAVVARLEGFGCRILVHDRRATGTADPLALDDLLRASDVVTLHTPLTPATHHLLDRRRIEALKPGAVVVNTGRGALLDTEALLAALESGRLGGAALDVVEGEEGVFYADCRGRPLENATLERLQAMPNVIISPHTAYDTDRALAEMAENSLLACLRYEQERHHHG